MDYWRFTPSACAELFAGVFDRSSIEVHTYGNLLSSMAFLSGMAQEDLTREELDAHDLDYVLLMASGPSNITYGRLARGRR